MAKQASIFRGMIGGKRCFFIRGMATEAMRFRFLFIFYCIKTAVIFIMGQVRGCFLRSFEKKNENPGAEYDEYQVDGQFLSGAQFFHIFALQGQGMADISGPFRQH
ncbi:MAG: hypothetical protein VR65_21655 [Desulfobulbaceae bacterium BRH_c16a]|nr:MAG: hypothetical protein VR65_21655 [Desulfobulbaceae bacterium BRH_c16a]